MRHFAILIIALLTPAAPAVAGDLRLDLPLDCVLGKTCYIQHLVDRDRGPGVQDFRCGILTYDGHKGTDFALPTLADMQRGVNVLAAAAGVVAGRRDEVADVGPTASTEGQECGNGVVLRHAGGWETQYCHMKRGSVRVQSGNRVLSGDVLGQVGLSGKTEFPHLHLSVRRNGDVVDPFAPASLGDCSTDASTADTGTGSLWRDAPLYVPGGIFETGFAPGIPDYEAVRAGTAAQTTLAADATGLVIYGFGFAGKKGDVVEMQIIGPQGEILSQRVSLKKKQAQFFRATGKRLTTERWPVGEYKGRVVMRRGSTVLSDQHLTMTID